MSKYIKVDELHKALDSYHAVINTGFRAEVDELSKEMVFVDDLENIIRNYNFKLGDYSGVIDKLTQLIKPKAKKYAGFTTDEWKQLNKLAYIKVVCEDNATRFLSGVFSYDSIIKLSPDLKNMERTNTNIPDGIEVEYKFNGGVNDYIAVTPTGLDDQWNHYCILGIAGHE